VSPGLERVRQAAQDRRTERFTALLHHVDVDLLRWAYHQLQREAAAGVDGLTWRDCGAGLEARLQDLHARVQRGGYRAQPSRRHYIPKPDGRQRPLGIAALEDKIVQRATVEPLNASYEEDFRGFSYGFRAGRSQHDALDALTVAIERTAVSWILDADIAGFFDMVDHAHLIRFVEHRTPASARADRRVVRLIRKWLKVRRTSEARLEVMEDGEVRPGEIGTPQGAVISPLLANIYRHYVFDLWAHQWRQRHAQGNVIIVRYADDIPDQVRDRRLRAQGRGRAVSCGDARAPAAVRADAASGQDPPHRVRSLRGRRSKEARPWQTGELRLPWLHPHLRPPSARSLHRQTTKPPRSHAGQAAGDQRSIAAAAQPARSHELDADVRPCPSLASERPHHPSLALCPLHRHSPEVGARCSNRARRVLCGGCAVTRIPTATVQRDDAVRLIRVGARCARPGAVHVRSCR
jgi:RNA-directed DNA polymerase